METYGNHVDIYIYITKVPYPLRKLSGTSFFRLHVRIGKLGCGFIFDSSEGFFVVVVHPNEDGQNSNGQMQMTSSCDPRELTIYLAYNLTFCLTFYLAFYLAFNV